MVARIVIAIGIELVRCARKACGGTQLFMENAISQLLGCLDVLSSACEANLEGCDTSKYGSGLQFVASYVDDPRLSARGVQHHILHAQIGRVSCRERVQSVV